MNFKDFLNESRDYKPLTGVLNEDSSHEWRIHARNSEISAVLYTDHGMGFEYAAQFVHAREDGYEYYAQTVHNAGTRIEWGGEHTKNKRFSSRVQVNTFLKKIGLPELTSSQFDQIHPDNTIVVCVKGNGGLSTNHYLLFGPTLVKLKSESKSEDEFMSKMLLKLKDMTKSWTFSSVKSWSQITPASIDALKDYYSTGKTNKF